MRKTLSIRFDSAVPEIVRKRITYALQVFAAVHGYALGESPTNQIFYGERATDAREAELFIPALYRARPATESVAAPVSMDRGALTFHLFFGSKEQRPDFLGEIFEWISGADERSISERDAVGRIPFARTVFGRYGLSPMQAHASRLMAWLAAELRGDSTLRRPESPSDVTAHSVVCSHDLDFYYTSRFASLKRVGKNIVLGLLARSAAFSVASARQLVSLAIGRKVGDFLPLLDAARLANRFGSTAFVIADSPHDRDANYALREVAIRLRAAQKSGLELGLHGSYTSVIERRDLRSEADALRREVDAFPSGNRQHWLRFDEHEKLYAAIEQARFLFDSTLAFREASGFRNGICSPFPPYDFERERPCDFLEIPLVLMDTTLADQSAEAARREAHAVLDESRRWGWGGISILWHNPFEPLGVSDGINQIFWELLETREERAEEWVSGGQLVTQNVGRYHDAGLLRSLHAARSMSS